MSEFVAESPGFFGKVRTHGDFVTRRLPAVFVTPWDACLQQGMLFAQQWFGAQWLPVYLNAPVWCFALGAGVCGEPAWAGVLMPGVDRVGRYFPFTIAAPIARGDAADWLRVAQSWYDEATRLALSTLAEDFVLERFDAQLNAWGPLGIARSRSDAVAWRPCLAQPAELAEQTEQAQASNGANEAQQPVAVHEAFPDSLVRHATAGSSAWWTRGSSAVPPSLLAGPGLPDGERFVGLLDKPCSGWESVVKLR
jgi:type VI secretion system protein ImpM